MRVLITILALVTAPFLASVSQEPAGSPRPEARSGQVADQDNDDGDQQCENGEHPAALQSHSRNGHGHGHAWAKGHAKQAQRAAATADGDECDPTPPPPPAPPPTATGTIAGTVYSDLNRDGFQESNEPGL